MPDPQSQSRFCSRCGRVIVVSDANFCKECGNSLLRGLRLRRDLEFVPLLAAALSVVPGAGHVYKGQYLAALGWFIGVVVAYGAQPFGVLLHIICAANAALGGALDLPPARASDGEP